MNAPAPLWRHGWGEPALACLQAGRDALLAGLAATLRGRGADWPAALRAADLRPLLATLESLCDDTAAAARAQRAALEAAWAGRDWPVPLASCLGCVSDVGLALGELAIARAPAHRAWGVDRFAAHAADDAPLFGQLVVLDPRQRPEEPSPVALDPFGLAWARFASALHRLPGPSFLEGLRVLLWDTDRALYTRTEAPETR